MTTFYLGYRGETIADIFKHEYYHLGGGCCTLELMIKNIRRWEEFERSLMVKSPSNVADNMRIFQALYDQAVKLGIFPLQNPLEGLEVDIERSRIFNSIRRAS